MRPVSSGNPLGFRSLRTRLIVWNVCTLALILALLGGIVRHTVRTNLFDSIDRDLEARALPMLDRRRPRFDGPPDGHGPPNGFRIPPPWERGHGEPGPGMTPFGLPPEGDRPPPPNEGPGPPREHPLSSAARRFMPRIFDLQGHPLPPTLESDPWDRASFQRAAQGQKDKATVETGDEPMRILSLPVRQGGQIVAVVQAAYPLTEVNRAIAGMDSALLTLIPAALLLAGLGGALLTGRALRPIRRITQTAEQIGANDLSRRLAVQGEDEFAQLSATFNRMLARLDTAFQQKEALVHQLESLVEQQRRFTGDASHELRTPLTIIKANTSLLLRSQPTKADWIARGNRSQSASSSLGRRSV